MQTLETVPVADLVRAAWRIRTGRKDGTDRALWIAARHYVDRAGSVDLPKPIVDRVKELLGSTVQDVAKNGQAIVEG
jgi:hypothetical protein